MAELVSQLDALIDQAQPVPGARRKFRRLILGLAWPVVADMLLQTTTQIVDMVMVGRLGPAAVAAVGLSLQPLSFALSVFSGVAVGTTAIVARLMGAREEEKAARAAAQSFLFAVCLAACLSLVVGRFAKDIVTLMGAQPDALALGSTYLRLLAPGLVFLLSTTVLSAALRGAGDMHTPMRVGALTNAINVLADYALIFGRFGFPALGVAGAAVATTAARILGGTTLLALVFTNSTALPVPPRVFASMDPALTKRVLATGTPAAFERVVRSLGMLLYIRLVASLGTVPYAIHTICVNIESISFMPGTGLAAATATLVGQSLGAQNPRAAVRSATECVRLAATIMGSLGLVFLAVPGLMLRAYTADPRMIGLGSVCLRIVAFAQIPMGVAFVLAGALRGAGDTRTVLLAVSATTFLVRLTLAGALIRGTGMGLAAAWLTMVADWTALACLAFWRFRSGAWQRVRM